MTARLLPALASMVAVCLALSIHGIAPAWARSWQVPSEFATIAAAVDAAAAGDSIVVACGTYLEHDIVLKGGITVRGANADPACVVVDAQQLGRVFDLADEAATVVLEGLTITGGITPDGWFEAMGGGIRLQNASLRLSRCLLTQNTARIGAALAAYRSTVEVDSCEFVANDAVHAVWAAGGGMWALESSGSLLASRFQANTAFSANPDDPGDGGGVLVNASAFSVTDCEFLGNSTGGGGGGYYSLSLDHSALLRCRFEENVAEWGGAMYFELDSRATIDLCEFRDNTAVAGGALLVDRMCFPIFWDSLFEGNTATGGSGGAAQCWVSGPLFSGCTFRANSSVTEGGALYLGGAGARVEDCLFVENAAGLRGGAVHYVTSSTTLLRSTLVGNVAPSGSAVFASTGAQPNLRRSIVAFGGPGSAVAADATGSFVASCTDVFGNAGGNWTPEIAALLGIDGNFEADPEFVDAAAGDFRVLCTSPCAAEQSGSCGRIGAFGAHCPDEEPTAAPALRNALLAATAHPNPFNAHTRIAFTVAESGPVRVLVFGVDGRRVRTLASGHHAAGTHELVWDGRDDRGATVASGAYLCRVQSAASAVTLKLGLVK